MAEDHHPFKGAKRSKEILVIRVSRESSKVRTGKFHETARIAFERGIFHVLKYAFPTIFIFHYGKNLFHMILKNLYKYQNQGLYVSRFS